jgi:hypothetical protein
MPNYTASVAAATAVVNYDILQGHRWTRSPVNRTLVALGLAGSAAIGDTQPMGGLFIPAGAQLSGTVVDAATTSPINATLSIEDLV